MPTTDLTRNVFSASGSGGALEWTEVEGGASTTFRADAQLRRGINLDLGLEALAYLDGKFRRYLAAELDAEARGTLRVRGQIQAPLNLFKESGAAVRLQARAELAAGASLSLGLSVADFLELVKKDPAMQGLPYRLFEIFLEEVTIGAGLYAKAALSAMAYANLIITGSLIATEPEKPGFNIVAEAGAGLKAGAGYRVFARVGFDDVRRFVGRTTDVLVDETIMQIGDRLPPAADQTRVLLDATRAPAKMALRTAYEIGELVSTRAPQASIAGQSMVSQRCVQIILEETQRYLLDRLLAAALEDIERGLRTLGLSQEDWDRLSEIRIRLADRLESMPADPFAWTSEVVAYWEGVVGDAVALIEELGGWADLQRMSISVLWAAAELMFAATRRMLDASVAASAANLSPTAAHAAFTGPVNSTPPASVREYINYILGRDPDTALQREDLVIFLTEDVVFRFVTWIAPDVDRYLQIFETIYGDRRQFMRKALGALGAMSFEDGGQIDATQTLAKLAAPLKTFLHTTVKQELAPAVRPHLQGRGDLSLYFDEVVLPSMAMAIDVAFDRAQRWASGNVDRDALTEALSSVLMMTMGRSLVVTSDVLVTTASDEIHRLFLELAEQADDPDGLADVLKQFSPATDREDVVETVQEVLRIGGEAFKPLPAPTRAKIRQLLYGVMGGAVSDDASSYAAALEDPMLMPNQQAMMQLAEELGKTAVQNLEDFVRELLLRVAHHVLDEIKEQIEEFQETVEQWVEDLQQAIVWWREEVARLFEVVAGLIKVVEQCLDEVAKEVQKLAGLFSQESFRASLRASIAEEIIRTAETELNKNEIYKDWIPSDVKGAARNAMRDAVYLAVDGPIAKPVWDALGALAFEVNQVITDVRGFDPNRGIGEQLRDLIVKDAEDGVRNALGPNPGIDLKFSVSWQETIVVPFTDIQHTVSIEKQINLGRIELPIDDLVKVLRAVLEPLAALDAIVQPLSTKLAAAFKAEAELVKTSEQEEQARAEAEKAEKMEALVHEGLASYLDVTIIEPSPGALYDSQVPLRIDIAGAPLSFLGRNQGEQQRVLVWLNQKVLNLDVMQATIVEPSAEITVATSNQHVSGAKFAQPSATSTPASFTRGIATARSATSAMDASPAAPVQPSSDGELAPQRGIAPLLAAHARLQVTEAQTLTTAGATPGTTPMARALARGDLVVGSGDHDHNIAAQVPEGSIQIGRQPTITDLEVFAKPPVAVLRLTGKIPLGSFIEGINSIVVAVADGTGRRVEKAASFIVSPPLFEPAPPGGLVETNEVWLPDIMVDANMRLTERHLQPQVPEAIEGALLLMPRAERAARADANVEVIKRIREEGAIESRDRIIGEGAS